MSRNVVLTVLTPVSLIERKRTPVVTGTPAFAVPGGKVASATVKGLNGFWSGTLTPRGLKASPLGCLNASGTNGVAARAASKNERVNLKSANTSRYLSQISRLHEPSLLWRS